MIIKYGAGILVLAIAVAAIVFYTHKTTVTVTPVNDAPSMTDTVTPVVGDFDGDGIDVTSGPITVTYTDTGFSPASVTVKKGQSVTFVNKSSGRMWIGSDEHPSHTAYDGTARQEHCPDTTGTAFDQCGATDSFTFTFTKIGTWGYHNHTAATATGEVMVIE